MKNKQITIVDVAKAAGVSIATVSNVLNRRNVPLSKDTIRKVEAAAEELGYRRNVMAASLSRKKTYELGLLIPSFGGYYGTFADRMQRIVHACGYHLSVFSSSNSSELEQRHLETLLQRRVDGLFCHGLAMSPDTTRTIVGEGTPLVLFNAWGWPTDFALGAVNLDFVDGSAAAVRHLAARGCKAIFYMGKKNSRATDEQRRIGFMQGIRSLPSSGELLSGILETDDWPEEEWLPELLRASRNLRPVGVLAFDDFFAFNLTSRLAEAGIQVPHEVKVVGINNQSYARYTYPAITSLDIDYERQAGTAVRLLLSHIEGEGACERIGKLPRPAEQRFETDVPMTLIPRASTE